MLNEFMIKYKKIQEELIELNKIMDDITIINKDNIQQFLSKEIIEKLKFMSAKNSLLMIQYQDLIDEIKKDMEN